MRLFRKIRQSLLQKGNLKRYLVYTIGEILLIMIGVLLAFQVSKWNDNRNNDKVELIFYENIKRQLQDDLKIISGNVDYNNRFLSQFKYANEIIQMDDRSKLDTLIKISQNLFRFSDVHRASNIYETIVNSGQIEYIHNQYILEGMLRLEETYVYINKMESVHFEFIKLIVIPDIVESINFSEGVAENPDDLYNFKFKNRFVLCVEIMNEKNDVYETAIKQISEIVELIDQELKSK